MKGIAIILAVFMLTLNTGHLLDSFQSPAETVHMECCADCTTDCCDPEPADSGDQEPVDKHKSCHGDKACTPGCACSCHLQLSALVYTFMELNGTTVQTYHYANYLNTYSFEYSSDFLQPPRKA